MVRRLLEQRPELAYSVSCTTRDPRPGEVDGRDYRFVSRHEFDTLVEDGAFLEWAEVFGHRYGTLAGPIRLRLRRTETEAGLSRRLAGARGEMAEAPRFDFIVVNDQVDRAAAEVAAIIDGVPGVKTAPDDPRG